MINGIAVGASPPPSSDLLSMVQQLLPQARHLRVHANVVRLRARRPSRSREAWAAAAHSWRLSRSRESRRRSDVISRRIGAAQPPVAWWSFQESRSSTSYTGTRTEHSNRGAHTSRFGANRIRSARTHTDPSVPPNHIRPGSPTRFHAADRTAAGEPPPGDPGPTIRRVVS